MVKSTLLVRYFFCLNLSIVLYFEVGHHFQSSSDDEDDFKPISFLHTESSLQQVQIAMTKLQQCGDRQWHAFNKKLK